MNKAELSSLLARSNSSWSPFDISAARIYNDYAKRPPRYENFGPLTQPAERDLFDALDKYLGCNEDATVVIFTLMSALVPDFSEAYLNAYMDYQLNGDCPEAERNDDLVKWIMTQMQTAVIKKMAEMAGINIIDLHKHEDGEPVPPGYQLLRFTETEDGYTLASEGVDDDGTDIG